MQSHLNVTPGPPSDFDATITPALDEICLRAMAKVPDDRQQSMSDVLRQLISAAVHLQGREGWE